MQPNAPNITVTQTDVFHRIFADYFDTGTYQVSIFVCIYNGLSFACTTDVLSTCVLSNFTLQILPHDIQSLFPFGDIYRDSSFTGFDDHTALIFSSYGIPLWSKYYKLIFVSLLKCEDHHIHKIFN